MNKSIFAGIGLLTTAAVSAGTTYAVAKTKDGIEFLKANAYETPLPFVDGQPFENSRYYKEGDYFMHYRIDKAKKAPVRGKIFMIHGFACNTSFYDEMVEILVHYGFDCVRVDVPNCGYSTRENENVAPIPREQLLKHIMDLVDASGEVQPGKWLLMGHSMGGGISMNMAHDYQDSFSAVCLYAPMVAVGAPSFVKSLVTQKWCCNFCDNLFGLFSCSDPIMKAVVMLMTVDVRYSILYDVKKFSCGLNAHGSGTGMCYMMARARATRYEEMAEVNLPIQLVWGAMDLFNARGTKAKFQGALNNPEVSTTKLAGHCLVQNAAREIVDGTMTFLNNRGLYL